MFNPWAAELRRLFLLVAAAVLAGIPLGHPGAFVLVVLAVYLGWHLRNLHRLYEWLNGGHYDALI